jgi:hypothetical protein
MYTLVSKDPQLRTPIGFSTYVLVFIMMVLPGVVVFVGSYVQTIPRKVWGLVLVFIGDFGSLFLIVLNAGLAYTLVQDQWGQRAVLADFATVIFTMGTALVNVLLVAATSNKPLQSTIANKL